MNHGGCSTGQTIEPVNRRPRRFSFSFYGHYTHTRTHNFFTIYNIFFDETGVWQAHKFKSNTLLIDLLCNILIIRSNNSC